MKVLLVDDSKAARFAMRNLLEKEGLEVEIAVSGEEALEKLDEELADAVFMDQSMPGMGGIEATRKITSGEKTKGIPVVLCTGNEGDKLEEMAEEAGAIGVLTKPPQTDKLREILRAIGGAPAAEAAPATEDIEALVTGMLEKAITPIKESLDNLVKAAKVNERAVLTKLKDSATTLERKLSKQIKTATSKETGSYRIEFEELRQQLEAKLDTVQNKAAQLSQNLAGETTRRTETLINQKISELKNIVSQLETDITDANKRTEEQLARLQSGILAKAAAMVVVMGLVLAGAGYFLLGT